MDQLKLKLQEILNIKNTKIITDNIKSGINIFGIEGSKSVVETNDADATAENIQKGKTAYVNGELLTGTHEELDTSDANAVENDIAEGKSAYVNGVKVTGTVEVVDLESAYSVGEENVSLDRGIIKLTYNPGRKMFTGNYNMSLEATSESVAKVANLTGDKLLEGNTILGVVGTAKEYIDPSTTEDYSECMKLINNILGEAGDE